MTVLVISGALLGISENLARLLGLLEALLRILVVGIAVGVILHCKAAIGLLDLYFRRRLGYDVYPPTSRRCRPRLYNWFFFVVGTRLVVIESKATLRSFAIFVLNFFKLC